MSDQISGDIVILGITVPKALANVAHVRKSQQGETWVLATKGGIKIGAFNSEAELDLWWQTFRGPRGIPARSSLTSKIPSSGPKKKRKRSGGGGGDSSPFNPGTSRGSNMRDWDFD